MPLGLLRHPLTLRMFCEVTNPERKRVVGVEAMPTSLTGLFDRYLEQVAERIQELAPRTRRYYESYVRTALSVGLALWEEKARSLDMAGLRRRLGDDARPWDESIVRALENDGVLLRVLSDQRASQRTTDADIDPSFPEPAKVWAPALPDLFDTAPAEPMAWLTSGPTPDYDHLLRLEEVDEQPGPWVLLNGYVEQSDGDGIRQVFTFLRGLLVKNDRVLKVLSTFTGIEYPGNDAIPGPQQDYYTYAGEIPWSPRFGNGLRDSRGRAKRDTRRAFVVHDGRRWTAGIPVEVPVYDFGWESHNSALNQVNGVTVPAPALCDRWQLLNRRGEWDLYDSTGRVASLYREFKAEGDPFGSSFLYVRADLIGNYLIQVAR